MNMSPTEAPADLSCDFNHIFSLLKDHGAVACVALDDDVSRVYGKGIMLALELKDGERLLAYRDKKLAIIPFARAAAGDSMPQPVNGYAHTQMYYNLGVFSQKLAAV